MYLSAYQESYKTPHPLGDVEFHQRLAGLIGKPFPNELIECHAVPHLTPNFFPPRVDAQAQVRDLTRKRRWTSPDLVDTPKG